MGGGRAALAGILGQPPVYLLTPNGRRDQDYNDEHIQLVKEAGFEAAVVYQCRVAGEGTDLINYRDLRPGQIRTQVHGANGWNARRRLVKHTIA